MVSLNTNSFHTQNNNHNELSPVQNNVVNVEPPVHNPWFGDATLERMFGYTVIFVLICLGIYLLVSGYRKLRKITRRCRRDRNRNRSGASAHRHHSSRRSSRDDDYDNKSEPEHNLSNGEISPVSPASPCSIASSDEPEPGASDCKDSSAARCVVQTTAAGATLIGANDAGVGTSSDSGERVPVVDRENASSSFSFSGSPVDYDAAVVDADTLQQPATASASWYSEICNRIPVPLRSIFVILSVAAVVLILTTPGLIPVESMGHAVWSWASRLVFGESKISLWQFLTATSNIWTNVKWYIGLYADFKLLVLPCIVPVAMWMFPCLVPRS